MLIFKPLWHTVFQMYPSTHVCKREVRSSEADDHHATALVVSDFELS